MNINEPQIVNLIRWELDRPLKLSAKIKQDDLSYTPFPLEEVPNLNIFEVARLRVAPFILFWQIRKNQQEQTEIALIEGIPNADYLLSKAKFLTWYVYPYSGGVWGYVWFTDEELSKIGETLPFTLLDLKSIERCTDWTSCIYSIVENIQTIAACEWLPWEDEQQQAHTADGPTPPESKAADIQQGQADAPGCFPPGFRVVEDEHLKNDKGTAVPLTGETLLKFLADVYPYISEVHTKGANPKRWKQPDKDQTRPHYHRNPNSLIEADGARYWVAFCPCWIDGIYRDRYAVKLEAPADGDKIPPRWFFFIG